MLLGTKLSRLASGYRNLAKLMRSLAHQKAGPSQSESTAERGEDQPPLARGVQFQSKVLFEHFC